MRIYDVVWISVDKLAYGLVFKLGRVGGSEGIQVLCISQMLEMASHGRSKQCV